ncbi:MAG: DUF4242 domain-containing protein [Propionibacteriaceae bacterium]|nr:DUF4242 domain-containing protein [Propionibacteriaceae bacterium]
MSTLFLVEFTPSPSTAEGSRQLLSDIAASSDLVEAQITADHARVFAIVEGNDAETVAQQLEALRPASEPAAVRLVGADLATVKAARPEAGYLVEWDIPSHIDMDTYLTRKAEKTPLYSSIPEVSFLRTYVREDMGKCLCFYDAPDADAVLRAREIVSTPVNRLHALTGIVL